jgi:hypothetical protein
MVGYWIPGYLTILPIGRLFSSNRRRIGHSETPKHLGFNVSFHVIIFVNLLMFINHKDFEYQDNYPLTVGNDREGVLDEHTKANEIDALIKTGYVVEIVPGGDEISPPPLEHYHVQEGHERWFYQWSLYMAHYNTNVAFGGHSKMEVLFEIKTIHRSGKAANKPVD